MPLERTRVEEGLLIVAASGFGIGKGHLKRCSEMLERFSRFPKRYLVVGESLRAPGGVRGELRWKDAGSLSKFVEGAGVRVILFDTPEVDDVHLAGLRAAVPRCFFVSYENYFNDLGLFDLNVDMGYDRSASRLAHVVEGSLSFTVFDPRVFEHRNDRSSRSPQPEILISFGAADLNDSSGRALHFLRNMFGDACTIHLVIGPYFVERYFLRELAMGFNNIRIHEQPENIYGLMERCDLGVLNSGTTFLESLVIGLPALSIPQNAYERKLRAYLSSRFDLPTVEVLTETCFEEWLAARDQVDQGTEEASRYFRSFDGVEDLETVIMERFKVWRDSYDDKPARNIGRA